MVKWGLFIPLLIALLIQSINVALSAEWVLYYKNDSLPLKTRHFIDKASIHLTPQGTIIVWRKEIAIDKKGELSIDDYTPETWAEELREVDCSRREYRVLRGTIYRPKWRDIVPDYDWTYFTPDDMSTALFNTVCVKGKK